MNKQSNSNFHSNTDLIHPKRTDRHGLSSTRYLAKLRKLSGIHLGDLPQEDNIGLRARKTSTNCTVGRKKELFAKFLLFGLIHINQVIGKKGYSVETLQQLLRVTRVTVDSKATCWSENLTPEFNMQYVLHIKFRS